MKPTIYRRVRHRKAPSRTEGTFFKKESQETFFSSPEHDSFFQSAVTDGLRERVQRQCEKCEEEDKKVQRQPEKKEEEKVMRIEEKKEEKVMKKEEKKEEEKIQREPEKKEDKKLQKKEGSSPDSGGKSVSHYISSLHGKGESLPPQAIHFFSTRMNYDFSQV